MFVTSYLSLSLSLSLSHSLSLSPSPSLPLPLSLPLHLPLPLPLSLSPSALFLSSLSLSYTVRVGYILNITREIDNFYPEVFKYLNIRSVTLCKSIVCHITSNTRVKNLNHVTQVLWVERKIDEFFHSVYI